MYIYFKEKQANLGGGGGGLYYALQMRATCNKLALCRWVCLAQYLALVMYTYTCISICMRISTNHNSLGYEQPSRPRCRTITTHVQCALYMYVCCTDQLSVQLTSPSKPPADVELEAINNFLRGDPASLSWAEEGVANELSVVSVVRDTWINGADSSSNAVMDYVVRRLGAQDIIVG